MKTKYNSIEWIRDYLREISVIILGLCITYIGDSLVDKYYQSKEDEEYMQMLKHELNENITELRKMKLYYDRDIILAGILKTELSGNGLSEEEILASDSLINQHRYYQYWKLKDYVFSIMKETGLFGRIEKHKLTMVYECYEYMNTAMDMGRVYRDRRFNELLMHMAVHRDEYKTAATDALAQRMIIESDSVFCDYFVRIVPPMAGSSKIICENAEQKIGELLEKIMAD